MHRPICLALVAATMAITPAAGQQERADRQRLQLDGLYRSDGHRGFHQGDRDQGPLRHLRFQRHAGDQAAGRQIRLRRGGADRLFPRAPDQGRHFPEAGQGEAAEPREYVAGDHRSDWRNTIPATSTPSITCGARPASATTSRRRARRWAPTASIDSWDIVFKPGEPGQVQGLRRAHARFLRRHPAGGAAISRPRSEHHRRRPTCRRPPIS